MADALVMADENEQVRRRACGLGAVTSLALLDALLNLPLEQAVPLRDLSERTERLVLRAPAGVAQVDGRWVRRLLSPPLTVVAAVVEAVRWRIAMERVSAFHPFAQRLVVLEEVPLQNRLWEAQVAGVGVWVSAPDGVEVVCNPEPFTRRYWKAAGWRFAENAYRTATTSTAQTCWSAGTAGRPTRTAS